MEAGQLVCRIEQDFTDGWLCRPVIDCSQFGIVVDSRTRTEWVSGGGPITFVSALVLWDDGRKKWCNVEGLAPAEIKKI